MVEKTRENVISLDPDAPISGHRMKMLLHMLDSDRVLGEVKYIMRTMVPDFDFEAMECVYDDVIALFQGRYPGYRECNTPYHDLQHTLDTFLAMARLCHGAYLAGRRFSAENLLIGLTAALLHDAGYIQPESDTDGTGAKYTLKHVVRSADFAEKYIVERGWGEVNGRKARVMIMCTELAIKVNAIDFPDAETEVLGKILGTVDLLGQMAARNYLEKLLLLYQELKEGEVPGFESELDLLEKTTDFYDFIKTRLADQCGGLWHHMRRHFADRWNIDRDIYAEYIDKNMEYLQQLLDDNNPNYRDDLKRSGIVADLARNGL